MSSSRRIPSPAKRNWVLSATLLGPVTPCHEASCEKRQNLIMIKLIKSISITLLATLSLATGSPRAAAQEADAKLARFFQDYLQEHFRAQPLVATRLGDHRFDHLLDDVSRQARDGLLAQARQTLKKLAQQ